MLSWLRFQIEPGAKVKMHLVAQKAAKAAQNTPFRCGTLYLNLLICMGWGYCLANFKTAALRHSATPPFLTWVLAGVLTFLKHVDAFWCRVSPNCHQNFRVSRPDSVSNRDSRVFPCSLLPSRGTNKDSAWELHSRIAPASNDWGYAEKSPSLPH